MTDSTGNIVAGTVMYVTDNVAHSQYIAASEQGRDYGALDLLFSKLITDVFAAHRYFDFGISTEQGGRFLNEGLMFQKEGFGARAVVYDTYEIIRKSTVLLAAMCLPLVVVLVRHQGRPQVELIMVQTS